MIFKQFFFLCLIDLDNSKRIILLFNFIENENKKQTLRTYVQNIK